MELKQFQDVVAFALEKEVEAVAFYTECSQKTEKPAMKAAFLEMADEESKHVRMLENFKPQTVEKVKLKAIPDLKIADYLVDMVFSPDMRYQELLILAMKREEASHRLYLELAADQGDPEVVGLFQVLAQEEARHKLRLEREYDETVLKDN